MLKNSNQNPFFYKFRVFKIHVSVSLFIAALAAILVFNVWYPQPFSEISGGSTLFLLIVGVDVIAGPLITLLIAHPLKSRRERLLDFSLIGLLQTGALAYGLWAVAQARPVYVVFEYDRLRVVHAIEIPDELIGRAPAALKALPLTGPAYLALRPMKPHEQSDMLTAAFSGLPLSVQTDLWQPYATAGSAILQAARPASELEQRFPQQRRLIQSAVLESGRGMENLLYLPVVARNSVFWTALLDGKDGSVVIYLPVDSF